jgi:hypothetical protein
LTSGLFGFQGLTESGNIKPALLFNYTKEQTKHFANKPQTAISIIYRLKREMNVLRRIATALALTGFVKNVCGNW